MCTTLSNPPTFQSGTLMRSVCRLMSDIRTHRRRPSISDLLCNIQPLLQINSYVLFCPHLPLGKVWIYRLLFVCFCLYGYRFLRRGYKVSGVKFCTAVRRHLRQGISHFGELCSPEAPQKPKIGFESPASPAPWLPGEPWRGRRWRAHGPRVGSACVYIRPSSKTDVLVTMKSDV